jgi:UDP-N-acetylmuramoylalanine--D-glutamate ligase
VRSAVVGGFARSVRPVPRSATISGQPPELRGARVLVAGAGISGLAAAEALVEVGAQVTVSDAVPERLKDLPHGCTPGPEAIVPGTDLVVTSPGRRPDHPLVAEAARAGIPLVGEPELAWWLGLLLPTPPKWLVVTGTNGKTTTVGMLAAMLIAAGRSAVACGNIGLPVVTAVQGHEVLAVELSSFQLHWSPSVVPAAGCVLNVAEDHLDWHGSMAAYAEAKAKALRGPVAVAGMDDPAAAALLAASPAHRKVGVTLAEPGDGQLGVVDGVLVDRAFGGGELAEATGGPSMITDALAAAALARAYGIEPDAVRKGLAEFRPGQHRGAVVATVDGVTYVDDSKATNPHAAHSALAAADAPVVWIVGGLLKGASVDALIAANVGTLRAAVVIGTDRAEIVAALARHAPDLPVAEVASGDDDPMTGPMMAAVRRAAAFAEQGDLVLLAPAAASMDQFVDYAHRGRAFADAVRVLGGAT